MELLNSKFNKIKIKKCLEQITIGEKSIFYENAIVNNYQNDKLKIKVGNNTHTRGELLIFKYGGRISIGDNCYVGDNTKIWSGENIIIGNDVLISHNVNIMDTNSHEINYLERSKRYKDLLINGHWQDKGFIKTKPITISNNVWISFGVVILKGVTIGEGAIVGAGSVVTKDVPDWTIVAGNPAKIIREIPENER
ncbi:hypothetical protein BTO14_08665 [Polaribacter butkevichii]|uniref:Acyltransferase n=1 Tax=Polaribacter butkevichii TaxID=218490 RepID=A0A2P6CFT3_9FLAO|nr:hypothetical protein BTO14_08665 [Polaribacter butkevichii]